MTCPEARELFSARVDGEVAGDEAARLEEHLAGCDECRLEWTRFARVVSLAQVSPPVHAPAGFVDRVLAAADPTPWPIRVLRGIFVPIRMKLPLEAAAVLLVGGLAVMMFQRSPEMQQVALREYAARPAPVERGTPEPAAVASAPQPAADARVAEAPAATPSPTSESRPATPSAPTIASREPTAPAAPPAAPQAPQARPAEAPPAVAQAPKARTAPAPPTTAEAPPSETRSRPDAAPPDRSAGSQVARVEPPPAAAAPQPQPQSNVAQERRDALGATRRESAVKSTAATPAPTVAAPAPLAVPARTGPDVSAWVTVADRTAAMKALAETVTRHGGRETVRRAEGRADVVELAIPRDAYDAFIRDLSRLGGFALQRQTGALPASVSVSLRITD